MNLAVAVIAVAAATPRLAEWMTVTPDRVVAELRRLAPEAPEADRKAAAKWFHRHAAHPTASAALPALERAAGKDPSAVVRGLSVVAAGSVAAAHGNPCPAVAFDLLYDDAEYGGVRLMADIALSKFKTLPPGSTEKLARFATSDKPGHRDHGLSLLARHAPTDPRTRLLLRAATADPDQELRHNAHCYRFQATGDLDTFLAYILRFQTEYSERPLPKPNATEEEQRAAGWWNLVSLAVAEKLAEWTEDRPADLRDALAKALAHPDPRVRRGAAVRVGRLAAALTEPVKAPAFPELDLPGYNPLRELDPKKQREGMGVVVRSAAVRDRLKALADRDPDIEVRKEATHAREVIQRGER